jgi:hypothetical protein
MEQKSPAVVIAVAVLVIIAAGIIILTVQKMPDSGLTAPSESGVNADVPVSITTVMVKPATPRPATPDISEEEATVRLREDYPEWLYTLERISLTDRYAGKILYECALVPAKDSIYEKNETFFIDAATGDLYSPSQETAGITIEHAKQFARQAFSEWTADRVRMKFHDGSNYNRGWEFHLYKNGDELVHGGLGADTGELNWYAIGVTRTGRPESPSISMDAARVIADIEIQKRNGILPLEMTDSRLDPLGMPGEKVAGNYIFVYNRVIRDVPCDSDGFTITVDSVAGRVVSYRKGWSLPENAVSSSSQPVVSKDAAIKTVQQAAREIYPASAANLRIVSSDLRWKDFHNPDKVIPKPGSVPLAWKVQFDDETIRGWQWPVPANGWVDAKTGALLDLYYRHEH